MYLFSNFKTLQFNITQNQLNFMRIPQNQPNSQPIIISTQALGGQPQTILQMAQPQTSTGVYLNTSDD